MSSPSAEHEALVSLFRNRPRLAAELLQEALGVELPAFTEARVASAERTEAPPATFRADLVVELRHGRELRAAVVVEVQLGRDADKRYSWPLYLASVRAELRCPTLLLVIAVDEPTRRWAAAPIHIGHPGARLRPIVLGPSSVPVISDPQRARNDPELAVLSALAHGDGDPDVAFAVARATLDAILHPDGHLDEERSKVYIRYVLDGLGDAARARLEEAMRLRNYPEPTDLERRLLARGEASAKAGDILAVLTARGLDVPDAVRDRILACSDIATLDEWLVRAVHAGRAEEVVGEP